MEDPAHAETRPLVVQKFGGTSVGDVPRMKRVAARIAGAVREGRRVAVTVSAMGHATDRLIALAGELSSRPPRREMDVLLATGEQQSIALLTIALDALGVRARSYTGAQAGFLTDSRHGSARILQVNAGALLAALEVSDVAVVAGFQGEDRNRDITTLGRGGSDTTAVALAAALGAEETASTPPIRVWSRRRAS